MVGSCVRDYESSLTYISTHLCTYVYGQEERHPESPLTRGHSVTGAHAPSSSGRPRVGGHPQRNRLQGQLTRRKTGPIIRDGVRQCHRSDSSGRSTSGNQDDSLQFYW